MDPAEYRIEVPSLDRYLGIENAARLTGSETHRTAKSMGHDIELSVACLVVIIISDAKLCTCVHAGWGSLFAAWVQSCPKNTHPPVFGDVLDSHDSFGQGVRFFGVRRVVRIACSQGRPEPLVIAAFGGTAVYDRPRGRPQGTPIVP